MVKTFGIIFAVIFVFFGNAVVGYISYNTMLTTGSYDGILLSSILFIFLIIVTTVKVFGESLTWFIYKNIKVR